MGHGGASTSGQETDAKLYIVDSNGQVVGQPVTLAGDVASAPVIRGAGGAYTVYIVTFDMGYDTDAGSQAQGPNRDATLYAFDRDGNLKFSVPLNQ